jgi:hypothetical protein
MFQSRYGRLDSQSRAESSSLSLRLFRRPLPTRQARAAIHQSLQRDRVSSLFFPSLIAPPKVRHKADPAFSRPKSDRQYEFAEVLQTGHPAAAAHSRQKSLNLFGASAV